MTTVSAFHLHLLNLLAYFIVEAFLAHEFGWSAFMHGGLRHLFTMVVLFGALPLAANAACELRSRSSFLARNRFHPAARQEWLCT